jgi:hypothetical protein
MELPHRSPISDAGDADGGGCSPAGCPPLFSAANDVAAITEASTSAGYSRVGD